MMGWLDGFALMLLKLGVVLAAVYGVYSLLHMVLCDRDHDS